MAIQTDIAGDMVKSTYDPDKDGIFALAQLVAAVCSETEADGKITTHKGDASAHHTRYTDTEAQTTVKANVEVGDLKAPTKALPMNSQKITGLAAPVASADAARKSEVDAVDGKLDDVSHAEPTRALNTIYQNTSGKIRLVAITMSCFNGQAVRIYCDSNATPTTQVARLYAGADYQTYGTMTFIVPPGYYYEANIELGVPTLIEWHEWDLH